MMRFPASPVVACVIALGLVQQTDAGTPQPLAAPKIAPIATTSVPSVSSATWSVGADGWTVFRGSPGTGTCGNASSNYTGTCVVYVANAGNDATCSAQPLPVTTNPARPCATPAKAQTLLRNGSPDWMLLKKGDTWLGGMNGPSSGAWNRTGGRSAAEPMLISSYGTGARPLFKSNGVDTVCYSTTATRGQYMAIVGIECYTDAVDPASPSYLGATARADVNSASPTLSNMASTSRILPGYYAFGSGINGLTVQSVTANSVTLSGNPQFTASQIPIQFNKRVTTTGLALSGTTNFVIIEDCKMNFGSIGIGNMITATSAPIVGLDLRIRRNLLLDVYTVVNGGNGFYLADNQLPGGKILIEENLVDHAGWHPAVWGAGATIFSQNFYLHDNNPAISFLGNITANASATGAQVRNGGTVYNNLSVRNPIAFVSNPGVQFNATTYSYNVITEGNDIMVGVRSATAAAASGSRVISLDGVLTTGNLAFVGQALANLDNPGAITGTIQSVTATTVTMSVSVAPGNRGDGVKAGDRLAVYMSRTQGIVMGPVGVFHPDVTTAGPWYAAGSTSFYFPEGYELPSWIVPGMNVGVYQRNAFAGDGGLTRVASISADRRRLTTVLPTITPVAGGSAATGAEQNALVIWTPGDESRFPAQAIGPNNVFTTSAPLGLPSYAYSTQSYTRNINAAGNYFYNWNAPSRNLEEYGVSGANTHVPQKLNVAGSTAYPNATIAAYDRSIGGPGTVEHFLAEARLQSKDRWDVRYTAKAANNFIRNALGCNCAQ